LGHGLAICRTLQGDGLSEQPAPWKPLARHKATGREALWRIDDEKPRTNFEYSVTVAFEVREADGTNIGNLTHFMDWENSTEVYGEFNDDGTEVLFRANFASDLHKTLTLAPKTVPT